MNNVEIEVIENKLGLEQSSTEVKEEQVLSNKDTTMIELEMALELMKTRIDVQPQEVFQSYNPVVAPFVKAIKKIMSKLMRWYIKPICDNQTKFNQSVYDCIRLLAEAKTNNKDV